MTSENLFNGVNVDQLVATVNAIKDDPSLARFKFRATNEWVNGGHSRTKIQSFYAEDEAFYTIRRRVTLPGRPP